MMYLIGGAPRLGKSILAQKMLNEKSIPWFSTDVLCMKTEGAAMQFSEVMHLGAAQVVRIQLTKAQLMTKTLQYFIERQMETPSDFTLEGVHLLPSLVSQLHKRQSADVKSMFVVSFDRELVLSGLRSITDDHDWMHGASEEMQQAMADFVVGYSREIKSQAKEEDLRIFERTENFQEDLDAMLRLLQ